MAGAIEEAAKKFLVEAKYEKVFKHTFDVIEDYLNSALLAVGAIALSVRFLSAMGTGDSVCVLLGVQYENATAGDKDDNILFPYPSSIAVALTNYANFHEDCVNASVTIFMQWAPYVILIEVEKMFLKMPRVAGRIERFYNNIIEESLFGKDPDVAEDVSDDKSNTEAISRKRRRNEVCMSLKRSSIIHQSYVLKNVIEIFMLGLFIPFNIYFSFEAEVNRKPSLCELDMLELPVLGFSNGVVHFQCMGKKVQFFIIMVFVQVAFQIGVIFTCIGSLIWCLFFRSISRMLKKIQQDVSYKDLEPVGGSDFLFLFDLLAHSSGLESTLRVLTHSDETFRRICLPRLSVEKDYMKVEEDRLRITWSPAKIEEWLVDHSHRGIVVDCYDVTIFPAESIKNTVSKKAKLKSTHGELIHVDNQYSAWFSDLAGGRTEYIVTIACVIGRSRMKGERIVTNLLPYPPEKPRTGMCKITGTHEVEISWEPPKGDFTKYVLAVDPVLKFKNGTEPGPPSLFRVGTENRGYFVRDESGPNIKTNGRYEREISSKMTDFTITSLLPGEAYKVELKTKTGDRFTRQSITETVLTKPEKITSLTASEICTDNVTVSWVALEGHSRLKAYNLTCQSKDNKFQRELSVKHKSSSQVNSFQFENLPPATELSVIISTVCVYDNLKNTSDEERITFITLPLPPRNLELESRLTNSFVVKWEAQTGTTAVHKFKLNIQCTEIGYSNTFEVNGDKRTFNFSKLPDVTGTGECYSVNISYIVHPPGSDSEVESAVVSGHFYTKPLPPSQIKLGPGNLISWTNSLSKSVSLYKLKYKSMDDGGKSEEILIPADPGVDTSSTLLNTLIFGTPYKINIYGLLEISDQENLESKELHEKIILTDSGLVVYHEDQERPGSSLSRQVSQTAM
ncbi:uncharacterized protein LOC111697737 isoform X2 [Eurytemora carolleeae]|uniref:uncharacterized protein LOC111697737 isoform X2 n=1 Tax=Eurytemora carolleeae TaxID=1294199 RepID=UPI000C77F61E|nr:uncharacterized protein LOC111697737 isoform X2 [Eurytemora carolleeae]|eukprot:XP_023323607.1 uncharacterized protein LOC111697737 isoform X2 [Eurytemora affinis]